MNPDVEGFNFQTDFPSILVLRLNVHRTVAACNRTFSNRGRPGQSRSASLRGGDFTGCYCTYYVLTVQSEFCLSRNYGPILSIGSPKLASPLRFHQAPESEPWIMPRGMRFISYQVLLPLYNKHPLANRNLDTVPARDVISTERFQWYTSMLYGHVKFPNFLPVVIPAKTPHSFQSSPERKHNLIAYFLLASRELTCDVPLLSHGSVFELSNEASTAERYVKSYCTVNKSLKLRKDNTLFSSHAGTCIEKKGDTNTYYFMLVMIDDISDT
ncbi:hypothetical protein BDY19DRAFT_1049925 [Irpex rosettiformis]|uniref:Uncharacterized protein n=1 Tax=Irpex rosettiformis TaxID=378272 RepID=A0ACB8TX26_9APHY|nr:hypothetical protein BDY19DRAFT_1049925 [Irpex rosettiformis]